MMLNIRDICKTKQSKYWKKHAEEGTPAWQKITVALIVDGLEAMDKVNSSLGTSAIRVFMLV